MISFARIRAAWSGVDRRMISKAQAKELARQECERREFSWEEPVRVSGGRVNITFWTNADVIDANTIVTVNRRTGEVGTPVRTGRRPPSGT